MSSLKVYNEDTHQWEGIRTIQGPQGPAGQNGTNGRDGSDYVITQADYQAIANIVLNDIDATSTQY